MKIERRIWLCILFLAIINIPYSIVVYNHIGEDAFITFRYAENFINGLGLVYNPGERVEGYSNFSWLMLLAFFSSMGFSILTVSKLLAAVSNSMLIIVCALCTKSLVSLDKDKAGSYSPVFFLFPGIFVLLNPMLHYHADRGLETCFYSLLLLTAVWLFIDKRYILAGLGFAGVALTRPEGIFYSFLPTVFILWSIIQERGRKKSVQIAPLVSFLVPLCIIFGIFLLWRRLYFGYWFPNTVYAKVNKLNFYYNPSIALLLKFIVSWSFIPVFAIAGAVYLVLKEKHYEIRRSLLFLLFMTGGILVYTLGIGYILAAPFRHYAPAIPLVIVLLSFLLVRILPYLKVRTSRGAVFVIMVVFVGMNFYTCNNGDLPRSRLHVRTFDFLTYLNFAERWEWYLHPPIWLASEAGRWVHDNIPKEALLAADQMGQFGYYSGHRIIDTLGLMDEGIAHYGYSTDLLLRRNPDYIVWFGMDGEPFLPHFKASVQDPVFAKNYRLFYILRARNELDKTEYLVYAKDTLLTMEERVGLPHILYLGVDKQEFIGWWRI